MTDEELNELFRARQRIAELEHPIIGIAGYQRTLSRLRTYDAKTCQCTIGALGADVMIPVETLKKSICETISQMTAELVECHRKIQDA